MKNVIKTCLILLSIVSGYDRANGQMAVTSAEWDMRNSIPASLQNSYEVKSIEVDALINMQVAKVSVTQTIYNPANHNLEVEVFFPLPKEGIIRSLTMLVDGEEIPGMLLPIAEATGIYESIVRRKLDPALMEYVGYGLFKTSVFPIAIGEERTITVNYTQVLSKKNDMVSFSYPLGTQKFSAAALNNVRVSVKITADKPLKSIFSPGNQISIDRIDNFKATVEMSQQNTVPDQDFKLLFSMDENEVGANVLSYMPDSDKPGYFMLMASPGFEVRGQQTVPKNIIFVLDISGSMIGRKMQQSISALNFVLSNLNKGDRFNIITYNSRVEKYKNSLQEFTPQTMKEAEEYIFMIRAGGGTNIHDALLEGLKMTEDNSRPNYIMFLTDGVATSGITNEQQITNNTLAANKNNARIFSFGVGNDVNARLLDRISMDNGGIVEYVSPNEDIETAVGNLYANISNPVMTNISVEFSGTNINETYPEKLPDIFQGGQLIWVGRYDKAGNKTVTLTGDVNGEKKKFTYQIELAAYIENAGHEYVEKIWASQRIAYLIGIIDQEGQSNEIVEELVQLSKLYGILTPYTAFLAREDVELTDSDAIRRESEQSLDQLQKTSGSLANEQRAYRNKMANSPNQPVNSNEIYEFEGDRIVKRSSDNIRQIGNKTFYKKNGQWIDGSVEDIEENAINISMFSPEFFELSKNQSAQFNRYISMNENVVVELNGKVYQINKSF